MMRIAIFHDFFGTIGGGEKLVIELARELKADILTTQLERDNLRLMGAGDVNVISIGTPSRFPVLKQITASWLFSRADFPGYDFYILSGNWAIFAAKHHKPNLLYCHTPVRMFYQAYDDFKKVAPWWAKPFFALWVKVHRHLLEKQLKHIQNVVANSKDCRNRVKKYYHKDAAIVNPPIRQYSFRKYGNYWLSVNRLYPHKRIELQLEAFARLPQENLVIVGGVTSGDHSESYMKKMLKGKPDNVTFLGEVSEKKLEKLYAECKGFIATSQKEDFGMNVLEAMSAGKPVVAMNEGGYKETMINGKTGFLVNANAEYIVKAVKSISNNPAKFRKACEERASKYSVKIFIEKMRKEIHANS
jgi:glycosyltransferase involved in cell wall biosynthesis